MYKNNKNVKTLNRGEKMTKRKVKKNVLIISYTLIVIALVTVFTLTEMKFDKKE